MADVGQESGARHNRASFDSASARSAGEGFLPELIKSACAEAEATMQDVSARCDCHPAMCLQSSVVREKESDAMTETAERAQREFSGV